MLGPLDWQQSRSLSKHKLCPMALAGFGRSIDFWRCVEEGEGGGRMVAMEKVSYTVVFGCW